MSVFPIYLLFKFLLVQKISAKKSKPSLERLSALFDPIPIVGLKGATTLPCDTGRVYLAQYCDS